MAFDVTSNPYLDNLADPKRVGAITSLEPKKPALIPLSNEPLSIMTPRDNSIAAPDKKKSIFERFGDAFTSKKKDANPNANMARIGEEASKLNNFKDSYGAAGLTLSGNKPVEKTDATNPVAQAAPKDKIDPKTGKPEVVAGVTPKEEKEESVNEVGSLGDLQDKKQEIVDSKKGDASNVLSEKSERFQKLGDKSKAIDTKLEELKKNPEGNADEIEKLEAKKGRIDSKKSAMVERVAEKIAGKDKNYQELSKAEDKELKKVNQYADYDLKDESGKKLSKEDISNLGKQGKLFDEEGKPVSEEEFVKQGFKKTLTDKAAEADPMRALEEGTKEQKYKAFAMMMSGQSPTASGASKAPAKDDLYGNLASIVQGLTQISNQRNVKQKFGTFTNFK